MSRRWGRLVTDTLCGRCARHLKKGDPAQYVSLPNVKAESVRCEDCVGLAPPDLPTERAPKQQRTKGMTPLSAAVPNDWKRRQSGDREPGQEG